VIPPSVIVTSVVAIAGTLWLGSLVLKSMTAKRKIADTRYGRRSDGTVTSMSDGSSGEGGRSASSSDSDSCSGDSGGDGGGCGD